MSRFHSYINSSKALLSTYKGSEPFSLFSKNFFSQQKKFGSRDRKSIAHLCYCYFRLGKWKQELDLEERLLIAVCLCSEQSNELLEELNPDLNKLVTQPIQEKMDSLNIAVDEIFPWTKELSRGIDEKEFVHSLFKQPDLFIRSRPGFESIVKNKLLNAGISFKQLSPTCLALPNSTRLEEFIELDREALIQDLNSQRVAEFFPAPVSAAWDCCAASGGKSILLKDHFPKVELTVSDVRESILVNLKKRFARAGIRNYSSFVTDLTSDFRPPTSGFDLLLCDAPCTGSGTWSRTPEQLFYFDQQKILYYQQLQRSILKSVVPVINTGGYLLYCTCSVFRKENEENIEWLQQEFSFSVVRMELLKGYDKKADCLFVALLQINK